MEKSPKVNKPASLPVSLTSLFLSLHSHTFSNPYIISSTLCRKDYFLKDEDKLYIKIVKVNQPLTVDQEDDQILANSTTLNRVGTIGISGGDDGDGGGGEDLVKLKLCAANGKSEKFRISKSEPFSKLFDKVGFLNCFYLLPCYYVPRLSSQTLCELTPFSFTLHPYANSCSYLLLLSQYCSKHNLNPTTVRFLLDGEVLSRESTPKAEDLDDDDSIDVQIKAATK
jgi:hypothetical protein